MAPGSGEMCERFRGRIFNSVWTRRGGPIMSIARGPSENAANCKSSCPNVDVSSKLLSIQQ